MAQTSAVLVIGGPTASGKSALALDLAELCNGVVINADSMQLYADLAILTARPSRNDLSRVTHRLYGILDGAERSSVAHWRRMALDEIRSAIATGCTPIVVGGTGLYLKALTEGLSPVPPSDPEWQREAIDRHQRLGASAFHADLARLDPVMADRLPPGDTQRCIRAWEVVMATGQSLAEWQALPPSGPPDGLAFVYAALLPERAALYQACNDRFRRMVTQGACGEAERLLARGLSSDLPVMKALGVAQFGDYLTGQMTMDEAVAKGSTATRHYAKRQLTWFRRAMSQPGAGGLQRDSRVAKFPIHQQYSKRLAPKILSLIRFSR